MNFAFSVPAEVGTSEAKSSQLWNSVVMSSYYFKTWLLWAK